MIETFTPNALTSIEIHTFTPDAVTMIEIHTFTPPAETSIVEAATVTETSFRVSHTRILSTIKASRERKLDVSCGQQSKAGLADFF